MSSYEERTEKIQQIRNTEFENDKMMIDVLRDHVFNHGEYFYYYYYYQIGCCVSARTRLPTPPRRGSP